MQKLVLMWSWDSSYIHSIAEICWLAIILHAKRFDNYTKAKQRFNLLWMVWFGQAGRIAVPRALTAQKMKLETYIGSIQILAGSCPSSCGVTVRSSGWSVFWRLKSHFWWTRWCSGGLPRSLWRVSIYINNYTYI